MFEKATKLKYRFASSKGDLSVEQLWDVPLRSRDDFNLNQIAKGVHRDLESAQEESFVDAPKKNGLVDGKMEVVKHIIAVRLAEEEAAAQKVTNRAKKEQLLRILAEKQAGKLSELTEKELQKQINALE